MTLRAPVQSAHRFLTAQPVYWREAALCAPAIPLLLIGGRLIGAAPYAAVASGAAFCVGFGAARDLRGWRWATMIAAMAGTTLAAFVGVLAGRELPVIMALSALAAAGCAALALIDEDLWWIALQMVIALLIASYYAGPIEAAATRSVVVLAGGAVQTLVVVGLAQLFPSAAGRLPAAPPKAPSPKRLFIGHTLRAAACVAGTLWLAHRLGLSNGYWAPMTAMLVLKPGLTETETRGLARVGGTVIGAIGATFYALVAADWPPLLIAGVGVCAAAAFALQKAHYAVLTSFITATVVLLLALALGGGALVNAEHRLIATLLGGVAALVVARIAPHKPRAVQPEHDRVGRTAAA